MVKEILKENVRYTMNVSDGVKENLKKDLREILNLFMLILFTISRKFEINIKSLVVFYKKIYFTNYNL